MKLAMVIEFSIKKLKAPVRFQQKIPITIDMFDRQPILSSIDMYDRQPILSSIDMYDRQPIFVLTCVTDNLFMSFSFI